jgi:hypothetical protein
MELTILLSSLRAVVIAAICLSLVLTTLGARTFLSLLPVRQTMHLNWSSEPFNAVYSSADRPVQSGWYHNLHDSHIIPLATFFEHPRRPQIYAEASLKDFLAWEVAIGDRKS